MSIHPISIATEFLGLLLLLLLFLHLRLDLRAEVEREVDEGFPRGGEVRAVLTGDIGAELALERLMNHAGTLDIRAGTIGGGGRSGGGRRDTGVGVEEIHQRLPVFMRILLLGAGPCLSDAMSADCERSGVRRGKTYDVSGP